MNYAQILSRHRVIFIPGDSRNKITMNSLLAKYVNPGSNITSDYGQAYNELSIILLQTGPGQGFKLWTVWQGS